jgi:hypothetical protein
MNLPLSSESETLREFVGRVAEDRFPGAHVVLCEVRPVPELARGADRDGRSGVPRMFVQAKAGHAHGSTTERYLHATKTS